MDSLWTHYGLTPQKTAIRQIRLSQIKTTNHNEKNSIFTSGSTLRDRDV